MSPQQRKPRQHKSPRQRAEEALGIATRKAELTPPLPDPTEQNPTTEEK